jgi:hypothetical protein
VKEVKLEQADDGFSFKLKSSKKSRADVDEEKVTQEF